MGICPVNNMKFYRNKKSGHLYKIVAQAVDVTENKMVEVYVYMPLIGSTDLYVRSKEEFHRKFTEE